MPPPVMEYLRWVRQLEPGAEYDLTWSGMPEVPLESLALPPAGLLPDERPEWGSPLLRAAIAESYSLSERNVLPVNGCTFGVYLACAATLERGDRILVEEPAYEPLRLIPSQFGVEIVRFARGANEKYRLDRERFRSALAGGIRLAILSDPHNPSGVRLSADDRDWLAATAEEGDFDILLDEVYLGFRDEDAPLFALQHGDRMISVSSLTKVHGFGRLRAGWMIARQELIDRAAPLYDYTIGNLCGPGVAFSLAAWSNRRRYRDIARRRSRENRALVAKWVEGRDDLTWIRPDLGIIAFPELKSGRSADSFVEFARRSHGVQVVPGRFFETDHAFRLGFGMEREKLENGLIRLGEALNKWGGTI